MTKKNLAIYVVCAIILTAYNGVNADAQDSSKETAEPPRGCLGEDCQDIDYSGPGNETVLDSHEAMGSDMPRVRRPRSAPPGDPVVDRRAFRNMLLGLVHKKKSDVADKEQEMEMRPEEASQKLELQASELLLELMVRIAAHPQQWNKVHEMLEKIDSDILTSKKILSDIQTPDDSPATSTLEPSSANKTENSTKEQVQRLIVLLDNKEYKGKNETRYDWPNLNDNTTEESKDEKSTTQNIYPWSSKPLAKSNLAKDFEFAYHRVTGKPLSHSANYDKTRTRNAYIAVSVIAPKSRNMRLEKNDNLLEEELRQLKPWSHQENLNKMENIRKKWFLNTDKREE